MKRKTSDFPRQRAQRWSGCAVLQLAMALAVAARVWGQEPVQAPIQAPPVAPAGEPAFDNRGRVLGDPSLAEDDLRQLYVVINKYRQLHAGRYPTGIDIFRSTEDYKQYGYARMDDFRSIFFNPDSQYSESAFERKNFERSTAYGLSTTRRDGTPIGEFKLPGTRDILARCDIYAHDLSPIRDGKATMGNPIGFYMLLWDDGQISKIPFDLVLLTPGDRGSLFHASPGKQETSEPESGSPWPTGVMSRFQITEVRKLWSGFHAFWPSPRSLVSSAKSYGNTLIRRRPNSRFRICKSEPPNSSCRSNTRPAPWMRCKNSTRRRSS
jgi:hypothetical protein